MKKPFNLLVLETKQNIMDTINRAEVPATVIQLILKDILTEVNGQLEQILKTEQKNFEESLNLKEEK